MKKAFFYVLTAGAALGIAYYLCKKGNSDTVTSQSADENDDFETDMQDKEVYCDIVAEEKDFEADTQDKAVYCDIVAVEKKISDDAAAVEQMYQAKSENAQAVYERHTEAGAVMKEAYGNIMEDFVKDFSDENENTVVADDSKTVSVMKELDSVSDKLDNLLK